jgi:DNA-binding GntR family transcriptional regulator
VYALIDLFNVRRLSRVEQVLAAETLSAAVARKLGQAAGSAALVATRRYFGADGRLFALAITTHAGPRFRLCQRAQPRAAAGLSRARCIAAGRAKCIGSN